MRERPVLEGLWGEERVWRLYLKERRGRGDGENEI